MENREEVIKAFFSDEEKVQAIAKDEEFIGKVSRGEATPETYKEEFKKFGLDLTDEEASQTAEIINKIHNTPDEKLPEVLNDLSLENISGGGDSDDNTALYAGLWIAGGVTAAGIITVCIGGVCGLVASTDAMIGHTYANHGKTDKAAEYFAKAKKLYWMFPKQKSYYDSRLKGFSKKS